jgi:hypothetical protein
MNTRQLTALQRSSGVALVLLLALVMVPSKALSMPQNQSDNLAPPAGTILPVRLNDSISSANAQRGETVTATVMQAVPLPNRASIPEGTTVLGHVVSVQPATETGRGEITIQFDRLQRNGDAIPIGTSLRALAGWTTVQDTQIPAMGPDAGTPVNWQDLTLVGGGVRYGTDGPVTDSNSRVLGHSVADGVLVRPEASSDPNCDGAVDNDDLQAMWYFSPEACGVYGKDGVFISHAGRDNPQGQFTVTTQTGDVKLSGGDGMLLRVVSSGS